MEKNFGIEVKWMNLKYYTAKLPDDQRKEGFAVLFIIIVKLN